MMNKEQKLEWRVAAYMALWTAVAALVKWAIVQMLGTSNESVIGYSLIGVICMTYAIILSFVEKHGNTPFLWIKTSPTNQHWAMPGLLGVFTNASSIAAIGIGFMATNLVQLIALFVIASAMMILQRRYIELSVNSKIKRALLGLVVPTIAMAFVTVGFFYNNAYEVLVALV